MADFRLHQLSVGDEGTNYLLLPKMGDVQMEILARRMETLGFAVARGVRLVGRKKTETVTVSRVGFARSRSDLIDVLAPAVPELLASPPQAASARWIAGLYLESFRTKDGACFRLKPRLEALTLWGALRRKGISGSTPDEVQVLRTVVGEMGTVMNAVTDYPREGASMRQLGRRLYFSSPMPVEEFAANLPSSGAMNLRNAFLPRSAALEVQGCRAPPGSRLSAALASLGTWCFFRPKSSNSDRGGGRPKPR